MTTNNVCCRVFPFLRLPAELRRKIFIEILGDRLVHLNYHYRNDDNSMLEEPSADTTKYWSLLVCDPTVANSMTRYTDEKNGNSEDHDCSDHDDVETESYSELDIGSDIKDKGSDECDNNDCTNGD